MRPWLILVRGLPGSGKTTFAEAFADIRAAGGKGRARIFAADDYFTTRDGEYVFKPDLLPAAHADCLDRVREWLAFGGLPWVTNTFSQRWEIEPYLRLVWPTEAVVVDLFDGGGLTDAQLAERCVHKVPEMTITRLRNRWQFNWRETP